MLAVSHRPSSSLLRTSPRPADMDDFETINPAALNAQASTISPNLLSQPSPRGTKRARSPEGNGIGVVGQDAHVGDAQINKRSKPLKQEEDNATSTPSMAFTTAQPVQTPHIKTQSLPQNTPSQTSPARSTPGSATKPAVVKALPTVRDHTTDQLGPGGDEYVPREIDQDGERKVSPDGHVLNGRKYRCRTFQVPERGDKLFMLATECARVLGYRDSYLLFNKNRSLYKIIASQQEKDNLISQEILPYSYRSRQIAIVTARSMFRQFGSRLIEYGRRVRDDYWEAKARKQGFTEEDAAGEKRPGAAKAREAAAAEASHAATITSIPQGEIIYNNGPGLDGQPPGMGPVSLAPLPMISIPADELQRPNSLGNALRPRMEITGAPYQDRIQSSSAADIMNQATQAAEYNKQLSASRSHRSKYLDDYWKREHEQPTTQATNEGDMAGTVAPQHLQSPQAVAGMGPGRGQQDHPSHASSHMMPQPGYGGYPNQHNPGASPVQQMHRMPPGQMHPSTPMSSAQHRQTPSYGGYPQQSQMWPPPQPQPSPLSQTHHLPQYGGQQQQQQQHHQQQQQSGGHMGPPQMPPQQMNYAQQQQQQQQQQQMGQMGNFPGMNRSLYQPSPSPSQYSMQSVSAGQQQGGMQGWSAPGAADWQQRFQ